MALGGIGCLLVGVWSVWIAGGGPWPLPGRELMGIVAVGLVPGYALVLLGLSILNRRSFVAPWVPDDLDHRGIGFLVERLVLGLGVSLCVLPLVGFAIEFSPAAITGSILLGILGAISSIAGIGAIMLSRNRAKSLNVPVGRPQTAMQLVIIIGFVVVIGGVGAAALTADHGEPHTEFSLTTVDTETGEHVAAGYPQEISGGERATVHVGITNNEREPTNYTVMVVLQDLEGDAVTRAAEIESFTVELEDGETWRDEREIDPPFAGEDLRVTYLLFDDEHDEDPAIQPDEAHRANHFWVDVAPTATD